MADTGTANLAFPNVTDAGFGFENCRRNEMLVNQAAGGALQSLPKARKTGTTIVGVVYADGVVLGADTRATSSLVVDKNCEKIHYIAPNIYCCGAGTAADTEMTTGQISSELELLRLNNKSPSRVVTAMTLLKRHLFNYQGQVSAALVLGGVDITGPHLYTVYPHGSTDKLPFVTMGSGSLAAMSVFETGYKDNMTEEEAKLLVRNAIRSGIFNDLGSGSNVDLCILRKNGVEMLRNFETPNDQGDLRSRVKLPAGTFDFPKGTTPVVKTVTEKLVSVPTEVEAMEVS